jgi:hypothetical protein
METMRVTRRKGEPGDEKMTDDYGLEGPWAERATIFQLLRSGICV